MKSVYIKAISTYFPESILTNAELQTQFPEWSAEKVSKKTGINQRHISASDQTAGDMAVEAANNLFAEHDVAKEEIDYVLFCTQSPDYFLPATSCLIQQRLGLSTRCGAIDINQGCSGYIYGLSLAKGLVGMGIATNVLFITSETYTKHIHTEDKGNKSLFGDAATATVISSSGNLKIEDFVLGTNGEGAANLIVKTGALRSKQSTGQILEDEVGNPMYDDYLYMNGGKIFNFTLDAVPTLVQQVLAKHSMEIKDVNQFIFHQANKFMLDTIRKVIGIPQERFFHCLENTGNTVSSTIPIALKEYIKIGDRSGETLLLAGFGVGYSWGGVVLKVM